MLQHLESRLFPQAWDTIRGTADLHLGLTLLRFPKVATALQGSSNKDHQGQSYTESHPYPLSDVTLSLMVDEKLGRLRSKTGSFNKMPSPRSSTLCGDLDMIHLLSQ